MTTSSDMPDSFILSQTNLDEEQGCCPQSDWSKQDPIQRCPVVDLDVLPCSLYHSSGKILIESNANGGSQNTLKSLSLVSPGQLFRRWSSRWKDKVRVQSRLLVPPASYTTHAPKCRRPKATKKAKTKTSKIFSKTSVFRRFFIFEVLVSSIKGVLKGQGALLTFFTRINFLTFLSLKLEIPWTHNTLS